MRSVAPSSLEAMASLTAWECVITFLTAADVDEGEAPDDAVTLPEVEQNAGTARVLGRLAICSRGMLRSLQPFLRGCRETTDALNLGLIRRGRAPRAPQLLPARLRVARVRHRSPARGHAHAADVRHT